MSVMVSDLSTPNLQPTTEPSIQIAPLSIRRNFSWTLFGSIVYSVCTSLTLVFLARLGSAEIVGQFALGLAIAQPVMIFAQLHLRAVLVTDARNTFHFDSYLRLRLLTTAIALTAILLVALFSGHRGDTVWVIAILSIGVAFDSISDIYLGYLQHRERMDYVGVFMTANGILSMLGVSLGGLLPHGGIWAAAGWSAASACMLLCYLIPKTRNCRAPKDAENGPSSLKSPAEGRRDRFSKASIRPLLHLTWLCAPMGIAMTMNALTLNLPRYFIVHHLSEKLLGVFATTSVFAGVGRTLFSSLGQAACPRLARLYALSDHAHFYRLLYAILAAALLIGGGGILFGAAFGHWLLGTVFGPAYVEYFRLLMWMLVAGAAALLAAGVGLGLTAARRFIIQLPLAAAAAVTCLISSWIFIPRFGVTGAAISLLCSALVQLVLCAVALSFLQRRARVAFESIPSNQFVPHS